MTSALMTGECVPMIATQKKPKRAKARKATKAKASGISFVDLDDSTCRWPNTVDGNTWYCGKTIYRKKYCRVHYAMAYIKS